MPTPRTKTCAYRHCSQKFQDNTPKNSRKYCCPEHARREKAFRLGHAKDESFFRSEKSSFRTCRACGSRKDPVDIVSGRCSDCRTTARKKSCRKCGASFEDTSLKNTMRLCPACSFKEPRRAAGSSSRQAPLPGSTSHQGRLGELLFLHVYPDAIDARSEYGHRAPFDAYHPDLGKVSVKTAKARGPSWPFQLGGIENSDHVFMIGLSPDGSSVSRVWLASSKEMPRQMKVMTPSSREYDGHPWELAGLGPVLSRLISTVAEPPSGPDPAPERYSRTVLGRIGEALYKSLHPNSRHVSEDDPQSPFDFLDPDGARVDVKLRRPDKRGRWTFVHQNDPPDVFFCVGLSRDGKTILEAYRVPREVMPPRGFSVRSQGRSKWHQYRVEVSPRSVSDVLGVSDLDRVSSEISCATRESLDALSPGGLDIWVQEVMNYHRALGFPYPSPPSKRRLASEIRQIREYQWSGSGPLPALNAGLGLCSAHMPHRFDTKHAAADFTALGAFKDDRRLERAVRFALSGKAPNVSRRGLRSSLTALNKTPTNFRPAVAKALVDRFCAPGGLVLDPCAGWGGRLVGTLVAGRSYFGVDSSERTIRGLRRLGLRLTEHLEVSPGRVTLHHARFQEVDFPPSDFALTSPPYWTQEDYDGTTQEGLDSWADSFLRPLFQKTSASLKPGGIFVVNVSDVPRGREVLPLERLTLDAAESAGFTLQETLHMSKSTFGPSQKNLLPLYVFRTRTSNHANS